MARVLLALPMYHSFGYNTHFSTFAQGGTVFLMSHFSFRSFLRAIQDYKVRAKAGRALQVKGTPPYTNLTPTTPTLTPIPFKSLLQITYVPLVPHIALHLARSPLLQEYDVSSLHYLFSGSAPMPEGTQQALMGKVCLCVCVFLLILSHFHFFIFFL